MIFLGALSSSSLLSSSLIPCQDVGVFVLDSDVGSVSSSALGAVCVGVCSRVESGYAVIEVICLCNSLVFGLLLIAQDVPLAFTEFDSEFTKVEFAFTEFEFFSWCNLVLIVQGMPFSTIFEAAILEFEDPCTEFEANSSS